MEKVGPVTSANPHRRRQEKKESPSALMAGFTDVFDVVDTVINCNYN